MVKLTMTEDHPRPIEDKYLEGGRQGWPLILSGLKTLVETGRPLPEYQPKSVQEMSQRSYRAEALVTKHAKPGFVYVTYIAATPEQVWQALTDGAMTRAYWYGRRVESDWKVGAPVNFWYDKNGAEAVSDSGIVLESNAPHRLSYTFHVEFIDELRDAHPSRVTFEIEPKGGDVKLTLTHDEFESGSRVLAGVSQGWPIILCSLKSFVETGKPLSSSSLVAAAQEAAA